MIMKKINLAVLFLGLTAFGCTVYADVTLQSKEEVQGTCQRRACASGKKEGSNQEEEVQKKDRPQRQCPQGPSG